MQYLDGMRAFAAVFVVLHHARLTVYPGATGHDAIAALTGWLRPGTFGVAVFIVVSGYSLMIRPARLGQLGESYGSFIWRRFKRILPPYWAALGVSLVLALTVLSSRTGTHWDISIPVTPRSVLAHLLVLQDLIDPAKINHVLWSVALEWHIYFLLPMLVLLWRRPSGVWLTLVLLAGTTAIAALSYPTMEGVPLVQWANFIGLFAVGGLACRFAASEGPVRLAGCELRVRWDVAAGAMLVLSALLNSVVGNAALASTFFGLAAAAALLAFRVDQLVWLRRLLELRAVVWVGTISYSLYLLHALVLQLLWQYVLVPLGAQPGTGLYLVPLAVIGTGLSVLVAWGFFQMAERPFMSQGHRARVSAEQHSAPRGAS